MSGCFYCLFHRASLCNLVWPGAFSDLQKFSCLCLPSVEITSVHRYFWFLSCGSGMIGRSRALEFLLAGAAFRYPVCRKKTNKQKPWLRLREMERPAAGGFVHLLFPAGNLHFLCHRQGRKQRKIHLSFASGCLCWILIRSLNCKNNSSWPPDFSATFLVPFLNLCSENVTLPIAPHNGILNSRRTCLYYFFSEHKTVTQREE